MLQQVDVTRRLAHYVAATRWEDVPPEVRHQAKRSFMNLFAVALAGCRTDADRDRAALAEGILRRQAGDRDRAAPSASMR